MVARLRPSPRKLTCALQCTGRIIVAIVVIFSAVPAMGHEDIESEVKALAKHGYDQLKLGGFDESIAAFQRCLELKPRWPDSAYDLACAYSVKRDFERAAEWFQRAIDWGFDDVKHVEADADMNNFRTDPRYAALVGLLRKKYPMGRQRDTTPGLTRLLSLVVMIRGEVDIAGTPTPTYGAGILFGYDGERTYVVTANHVVRYGQEARNLKVLLKAKPERWLDATLMPHFDGALDVAVLSLEPLERQGLQFCGLPVECTALAPEWRRGENVYPVGYPNAVLWGMPVAPDRVAQVIGHEIAFQSAFIAKGHSGGALISAKGALVGLLRAEEPPYGVAIAIERVFETLREWKYPIHLRELATPVRTALHAAAEKGAIDEMRRLLENCASPNAADAVGWTPLHAAAKSGSGRAAELLLEKGAEPYVWTFTEERAGQTVHQRDWRTPLHVAAGSGSADVVRALLSRGMNPDVRGLTRTMTGVWPDESPLEIAATLGHTSIISLLAKAGANVNGDRRKTPLHFATEAGKLESVSVLLELGANPTPAEKGARSDTPLHVAIEKGHVDIVRAMLATKPNLSVRLEPRYPLPLTVAVEKQANEIVRLLVGAGARADAGTLNAAIRTRDVETLKFLLRTKPSLNEEAPARSHYSDMRTPLAAAIEGAQLEAVKMLVAAGADVNRAGWFDNSPLFIAMMMQEGGAWSKRSDFTAEQRKALPQIEEFLIARGARLGKVLDIQDLLWHAVRNGRLSAVKVLIADGADPNNHRYVGTYLGLAIDNGHIEIVRTLLKAGAELIPGGRSGGVNAEKLLTYGIQQSDTAIVTHALRGGAKVTDRHLELAVKGGNRDVIPLVRSARDGKK